MHIKINDLNLNVSHLVCVFTTCDFFFKLIMFEAKEHNKTSSCEPMSIQQLLFSHYNVYSKSDFTDQNVTAISFNL